MGKKKYYAVQVGRKKGIFNTWNECKEQIDGYSGAKYRGFTNLVQAQEYTNIDKECSDEINDNKIIACIDNYYDEDRSVYSYGIILVIDKKIRIEYYKGKLSDCKEMDYASIQAAIKALDIIYHEYGNKFSKALIYNNDIVKYFSDNNKIQNDEIKKLYDVYKKCESLLKIDFKQYDESVKEYEQDVKLLAKYSAESNLACIIKDISYSECRSHVISNFNNIKELNISAQEYIEKLKDVCNKFSIKMCLKNGTDVKNDKCIIIYFTKNYLNSEIHLYISKKGLTVDVNRGKNTELNFLIVDEINNKYNISKVEEKKYSYLNLKKEKLDEVIENLTVFNNDSNYKYTENAPSANMKYWLTIKSNSTGEKINVYVYNNNRLEVRGKKYLLWEDVCYIIEKTIGVTLDDIIGRITIGTDLEFKHDNIDKCDDMLRKEFDYQLVNDFMNAYDYDVILSVKCLFEHKIRLTDYGVLIDPLTRAFEGYFKSVLKELGLVSLRQLKNHDWKLNSIFDAGRNLRNDLYDKLNSDLCIRNNQLDVLKRMCEKMWDVRNPLNHSGVNPPLTYNNYEDGIKEFNSITELIKESYELLIKNK